MAVLKYFLLHEDSLVRDAVGYHLYEAWSPDRELVPLVLEACGRFGEMPVLHLLGFACRFEMSHRGVEETLRALERSHPPFAEQWLSTTPLELVAARGEPLARALSPRALNRLSRRRELGEVSMQELSRRLERIASRLDAGRVAPGDWEEAEDVLEALSRRERPQAVLARLAQPKQDVSPHGTLFDVELAGAMQLQEATPRLVLLLGAEHDALSDAAATSLARFGNPGMIRLVHERYRGGSWTFRRRAIQVMKAVKLEVAERALQALLATEPAPSLRGCIFDALRFHFTARAGSLLREELRRQSSTAPPEELQKALFVLSKLFGVPDGEAERWRAEARERGDDEILFRFAPSNDG